MLIGKLVSIIIKSYNFNQTRSKNLSIQSTQLKLIFNHIWQIYDLKFPKSNRQCRSRSFSVSPMYTFEFSRKNTVLCYHGLILSEWMFDNFVTNSFWTVFIQLKSGFQTSLAHIQPEKKTRRGFLAWSLECFAASLRSVAGLSFDAGGVNNRTFLGVQLCKMFWCDCLSMKNLW